MANGKSSTARRREVRKAVPKPGPTWRQAVRRREVGFALLFLAAFVVIAGFLGVSHHHRLPYQLNQLVTRPVVARVAFDAVDRQRTLTRKEAARENTPAIYVANDLLREKLRDRFSSLIRLADLESIDEIPAEERKKQKLTADGFAKLKKYAADDKNMAQWERETQEFIRKLFDLALLEQDQYEAEQQRGVGKIQIVHPDPRPGEPMTQPRYDSVWISTADPATLAERVERFALQFPEALRPTVVEAVMSTPGPTYTFDPAATERARQAAYEQTKPVLDRFPKGEAYIPAGTKITTEHLELLEAERAAYREWLTMPDEQRPEADPGRDIPLLAQRPLLADLGLFAVVALIGVGLWIYIFRYYPRVARNPMRGMAVTALTLLCLAIAVIGAELIPTTTYGFASLGSLLAVMVLAIVYDQRFALFVGGLLVLLVAVCLQLNVNFALVSLTGVGMAAAMLGEVRSRSKIVVTGLYAGLGMAAAAVAVALASRPLDVPGVWGLVRNDVLLVLGAGFVTGMFVQAILPLIEKAFRVTTTMTLKELNDASHPLLQRLAQEAPGTYQHSLRLADITEAAAEAIGADGLLCRVGAMYHDIGKMNKPMYFIENQGGGPNRHSKLSPAMSLLIIVGHVKDGIEMAREYALPPALRHFIESHHGTTLVEYFFHAAKKQKEEADQPAPSEFEFRYPGPKPQTREAAIMLLCDGIEAAARTIAEPTPVRLEQLVHSIAMKRLMDGQFDDCALTLHELARAEAAITKTLCAIYHARVKYPEGEKKPAPAAAEEAAAPAPPQAKSA
jgi:putative nucleotidyltransferase with HDIG domain